MTILFWTISSQNIHQLSETLGKLLIFKNEVKVFGGLKCPFCPMRKLYRVTQLDCRDESHPEALEKKRKKKNRENADTKEERKSWDGCGRAAGGMTFPECPSEQHLASHCKVCNLIGPQRHSTDQWETTCRTWTWKNKLRTFSSYL